MPLALYLAYTAVRHGAGATDTATGGWSGDYLVSMAAFGAMAATVGMAGVAPVAIPGARRLVERLAVQTALVGPPLVALSVAAIVVRGVELSGIRWLDLLASLWFGALPFVALSLIITARLDRDSVGLVAVVLTIALGVLGGLFQPPGSLSPILAAFAHVLPSYHLAALGWAAVAGHGPDLTDVLVLAGYAVAFGAVLIWRGGSETDWVDV